MLGHRLLSLKDQQFARFQAPFGTRVPGPQLVAPIALAPTRLGRLPSPFLALRWRKACRGRFAASTSDGAQYALFYG